MRVGSISAFHISLYWILEIVGVLWRAAYQICQCGERDQTGLVCSPASVYVILFDHKLISFTLFLCCRFHGHEVVEQHQKGLWYSPE